MLRRIFGVFIFCFTVSASHVAAPLVVKPDDFVTKKSSKSPSQVVRDLKELISKKGIKLFFEIPHHELAERDDHLRFTHVLILGNPKKGTKLMLCDQRIGYELPLRVLVSVDERGQTTVSYVDPRAYATIYHMEKCFSALEDMARLLNQLTDASL